MTMEHKAFEFDWASFESELLESFQFCIEFDDQAEILKFIKTNLEYITDPYEGDSLDKNDLELLSELPIPDLLDYALTKYYSVNRDFGLGSDWLNLKESDSKLLLGNAIDGFDPGCMGSYFQSLSSLKETITQLKQCNSKDVLGYISVLEKINTGLYVTF